MVRMTASDYPDDKINLNMTKGALLFGVPNQGMESQQLMSLLQEDDLPALYTASLLDERYGFRLRMNRAYDFYKACSRNNAIVYAFYETEETPMVCRVCAFKSIIMLTLSMLGCGDTALDAEWTDSSIGQSGFSHLRLLRAAKYDSMEEWAQ